MKLGVLCSGNLGFQILKKLETEYSISFVFCDSASSSIVDFCKAKGIPLFLGNPRNGKCNSFLENTYCDVLLSVNYLFIIEQNLIKFPRKYAINIHGSLLPKYRGRTPHVWAIINNEKKTGITAHLIEEGCDTGDIIEQIEVEIGVDDTGAKILDKFNDLYWPLVKSVLSKTEQGPLPAFPQDHAKATYFGKRTPEDGLINWNWQKERIFNWVRAQAMPYPGAFTYIEGEKFTIDKISFCDLGFSWDMPNGLVLTTHPLRIKTPNGVVQIDSCREIERMHTLKENLTILG